MAGNAHTPANLQYSIIQQSLVGTAGGATIRVHAVSGGRAGSKTPGVGDPFTMNNPFAIWVKEDHKKGIHGGPLPIGTYTIMPPGHDLGWSAQLVPVSGTFAFGMFNRSGFYIHGRGPHGSDGCIVPDHPGEFYVLMTALTKSHGGTLVVTF